MLLFGGVTFCKVISSLTRESFSQRLKTAPDTFIWIITDKRYFFIFLKNSMLHSFNDWISIKLNMKSWVALFDGCEYSAMHSRPSQNRVLFNFLKETQDQAVADIKKGDKTNMSACNASNNILITSVLIKEPRLMTPLRRDEKIIHIVWILLQKTSIIAQH